MLTLKHRAKDYELTFHSKVKTKVFSKLNTLDLSLVFTLFMFENVVCINKVFLWQKVSSGWCVVHGWVCKTI